ncbi:MAG: hypothetical protein PHP82_00980 [Candidatus ainarchaeum sp.]|nr:hypothetical protein [Candidatus ainarchaeum sp.]
MYTTLRVANKTKERLESLKEYKRESFDELLNRLVDVYPEVKEPLIKELLKESKEYEKKRNRKAYSNIRELIKDIEAD